MPTAGARRPPSSRSSPTTRLRRPGDDQPHGLHLRRLVHCRQRRNPGDGGHHRRHCRQPYPLRPVDIPAQPHRDLQRQRRHGHDEQPGCQRPNRPDRQRLHPSGYSFANWNTLANGTGTATRTAQPTLRSRHHALCPMDDAAHAHRDLQRQRRNGHDESNQVANVPTALTTEHLHTAGYTFAGWNTVSGGRGTAYTDGADLFLRRGPHPLRPMDGAANHTVTFDANGGSTPSPASKIVTYGSTYGAWQPPAVQATPSMAGSLPPAVEPR